LYFVLSVKCYIELYNNNNQKETCDHTDLLEFQNIPKLSY